MDEVANPGPAPLRGDGTRASSNRFAAILHGLEPLFDSLTDPIVCADAEWRIVYWNPVAAAAWKLSMHDCPNVVDESDGAATLELADHVGRVDTVQFDVAEIPDVHGRRRLQIGRASGDDNVVGELKRASAIIAARIATLDESGSARAGDPDYEAAVQCLSDREREILDLILDGNRVVTVARLLYLSENTVRNYLKRIYQKLDVHSLGELRERMGPRAVHRAS